MAFEKVYLGKGKQVPNLDIAKVTIPLESLQAIAYEMEGTMYVTFEVSKMKEADKFGRAFTCYYSKRIKGAQEPAPKKKGTRKKSKSKSEEIPF